MKYILKKKWHPSQVEEVGHVFETSDIGDFWYYRKDGKSNSGLCVSPHEIALLVCAGFLEKQEDFSELKCTGDKKCLFGCENCQKTEQEINLWTEEPPKNCEFYFLDSFAHTVYVNSWMWEGDMSDYLKLKTNNCYKTKQSAKEALKRFELKYGTKM